MSVYRRAACIFMALWTIAVTVVPAHAFEPLEDAFSKIALTIPLNGPSDRTARLQWLVKTPRQAKDFGAGPVEPDDAYSPMVSLDFGPQGPSDLAVGGFTLWRFDRLYATEGDAEGGVDWGTVALVSVGVLLVVGLAVAIADASDDPYGLEAYCRDQGGTMQNGQCILP